MSVTVTDIVTQVPLVLLRQVPCVSPAGIEPGAVKVKVPPDPVTVEDEIGLGTMLVKAEVSAIL